jgi:folate-dependent phosphoribosylglycinamide formyltransferase PurN
LPKFNVVMLTNGGAFGLRLLEELQRRQVSVTVVLEGPSGLGARIGRAAPFTNGGQDLARCVVHWRRDRKRSRDRRRQYAALTQRLCVTGELNSDRMKEDLDRLKPDFIVLGGLGILRDPLIRLARHGVINCHPALLPWVRGTGVVAGAIRCGVPIGCTCHYVDRGVDTGMIIERRLLPITGADNSLSQLENAANTLAVGTLADVIAEQIIRGVVPVAIEQRSKFPVNKWASAGERQMIDQQIREGRALMLFDGWRPSCIDQRRYQLPSDFDANPMNGKTRPGPSDPRGCTVLRYALQVDARWDAHAAYAAELLLHHIGVTAQRVHNASDADLVYAPEPPRSLTKQAVWIRADRIRNWDSATANVEWLEGAPVLYQTLAPAPAHGHNGHLSGDILYSTYALATGALEQPQRKNYYGVPIGTDSFLQHAGVLEFPAVASYSVMLAQSLRRRRGGDLARIELWPAGKKYAVVISHDVDAPVSYHMRSYYHRYMLRNLTERRWSLAARAFANWAEGAAQDVLRLRPPPARDPNFRFADWMELERKLGAKSCFYVPVVTGSEPLDAADDFTWDFRHPSIINALRALVAGGWEVGLHASTQAKQIPDGIATERRRLEDYLDKYQVMGVRHHYWAVDPQIPERTLWDHAAAGLQYDSSLGLNDVPGCRRGIAWPFQPFDRDRTKTVPILEIPPTLMDGGIFYRDIDASTGYREIRQHFRRVFEHGGSVVLDWHQEQLNPKRLHGAGPVLSRVLLDLVDDSDIFWASPGQLTSWWQARSKRLRQRSL